MALFDGVNWTEGFLIPLVKTVFMGGIILFIVYYLYKAFHNSWIHQTKFFLKYKIMRNKYPDATVRWCMECINEGVGYYDAKKILFLNYDSKNQNGMEEIYETLWIFDQILTEMNKSIKGGVKNERKFERSYPKIESKGKPNAESTTESTSKPTETK